MRENERAPSSSLIRFEDFELDEKAGELRRVGVPVRIAPKPFSMLCYLVAHSDRAVPKQELLERLWSNVAVSDAALASAVKDLRRALGDDSSRPRIVRTVRGRGIRFVAEIGTGPGGSGRAAAAAEPVVGSWAAPLPFVGRERELRELIRCAEDAARGHPRVALIVGAAGTGKTRLLEELARNPCCAVFALARGDSACGAPVPYLPFARALLRRFAAGDALVDQHGDGDSNATLRRLLHPPEAEARTVWQAERTEAERERGDLFAAFWRLLQRVARAQPTLLVIEDLDRSDAASVELLVSLAVEIADARRAAGVPLLLVATTQPPQPGDRLDLRLRRLTRLDSCTSIELVGLGARATSQLLAGFGIASRATSVSNAVSDTRGGNPFVIEQLLREASGAGAPSIAAVADLHDPLAHRLARLSDECRRVLTVAAFIGDRFGLLALGAATGCSPRQTAATLTEAVRLGLIVSEHGSLRFEHHLVRDALRDATPEERRAEIHRDIAGVLADLYASGPGEHSIEIAHHLALAGALADPDRLVSTARRAGDQAFTVCAWQEAAHFYEAVLTAPVQLAIAERAELQLLAGLASSHDRAPARALLHFKHAAESFKAAGDELGFAWALVHAARTRFMHVPTGASTSDELQELEALVGKLGEAQPALRGSLLQALAVGAWNASGNSRAEGLAEDALAVGSSSGEDVVCFYACMALALTHHSKLRPREALASCREAEAYARSAHDLWLQSLPGGRIVFELQRLGRFGEARSLALEAVETAHRAHNAPQLAYVLAQLAALELASGNFAAARRRVREALSRDDAARYPWAGSVAHVVDACAAAQRGRWNDAEAALREAGPRERGIDKRRPAVATIPATWLELIRAYRAPEEIDRGRFAELVSSFDAAPRSGSLVSAYTALAEVAVILEAPRESRAMESSLRLAHAGGFVFSGPWTVLISRSLANCAALDGRLDEAEQYFDEAVRTARASGARIELARTLVDRARMHTRHGVGAPSIARARADLSAAAPIVRELGLRPLERSARAVARELGANAGRRDRNP